MRGIQQKNEAKADEIGITPAHAGNTTYSFYPGLFLRDHPRACGEYNTEAISAIFGIGSPPRMRGILMNMAVVVQRVGITPAHAGNTVSAVWIHGKIRDHPRACGEYIGKRIAVNLQQGSPPRMRGIRTIRTVYHNRIGITPAHAGNTPGP